MHKAHWTQVIVCATAISTLCGGASDAEELALGARLPAVAVNDQDGRSVDLSATAGEGLVLVYFYPKADTPGCTKQACSLRDSYAALVDKGVRVYGASTDDEAAQKAFKEKHRLPFTLLADKDKKLLAAFGVPQAMGFAKRQAFLFRDGVLVWRDLQASTAEQAADVLAAIDGLSRDGAGSVVE
jgi:peroxiredoxin Q/BCP